jgi:hypothetical protein
MIPPHFEATLNKSLRMRRRLNEASAAHDSNGHGVALGKHQRRFIVSS